MHRISFRTLARLVVLITAFLIFTVSAHAQMKAHFINVGQAEAILLEFKRHAVLIDAGGEATGDSRTGDHLIGYLDKFFQRRTDLRRTIYSIIISHPHIDHTRHLMDVMENYTVLNLVDGGGTTGSGIRQNLAARRYAEEHNIIYNIKIVDERIGVQGYTTSLLRAIDTSASDARIRFLGGYRGCENENNDSLVMLIQYKEATFLLTGDAESTNAGDCPSQTGLLLDWYANTELLDIDVYKVGHHGSHNGTTEAFLRAITPEISIISAGHHSTRAQGAFDAFHFGHPREKAVTLIETATSTSRPPVTVIRWTRSRKFGGIGGCRKLCTACVGMAT